MHLGVMQRRMFGKKRGLESITFNIGCNTDYSAQKNTMTPYQQINANNDKENCL